MPPSYFLPTFRNCLHVVSRLLHLGSRLQTLLTASEEREVTQHVYELMEAEEELEKEEAEGREALLKEICDNPRCLLLHCEHMKFLVKYLSNDHSNRSTCSKVILIRFRSTLESLTLFKLPDSALYFLSHMERLLSPSFTPSTEDMIRMRRATTGIQVSLDYLR